MKRIHTIICIGAVSVTLLKVQSAHAQTGVGINATGAPADNSAGLDVNYTDKGVLVPRVTLTITTSPSPVTSPASSLLVYNMATINDVTPGYYYWDGTQWVRLATGTGSSGGTTINCGTSSNSDYTVRGNGSGTWECTNVLRTSNSGVGINASPSSFYDLRVNSNIGIGFSPSSSYALSVDGSGHFTDYVAIGATPSSSYRLNVNGNSYLQSYVGINTAPSSSYELRVDGNVGIGFSPSSSYELSVDGQTYITDGLRVGTSSSPASGGILSQGDIKINSSSNSFIVGSTNLTGSGNSVISGGLSVGTTSSPPSSGLRTSGGITSGGTVTSGVYNLTSSSSSTGTTLVRTSSGNIQPLSSTIKIKENIKDLAVDKEKFLKIRPVSFNLKKALGGDPDIGLIAEEVEKLVPDLVVYGPKRTWIGDTGLFLKDENGADVVSKTEIEPYGVKYERVAVYLIKIVADQDRLITEQQNDMASLKERLDKQELTISKLIQSNPALQNETEAKASKK
ncbi:MAG: tail fiber domain-containing protein [Bacteroidota bacterium]